MNLNDELLINLVESHYESEFSNIKRKKVLNDWLKELTQLYENSIVNEKFEADIESLVLICQGDIDDESFQKIHKAVTENPIHFLYRLIETIKTLLLDEYLKEIFAICQEYINDYLYFNQDTLAKNVMRIREIFRVIIEVVPFDLKEKVINLLKENFSKFEEAINWE